MAARVSLLCQQRHWRAHKQHTHSCQTLPLASQAWGWHQWVESWSHCKVAPQPLHSADLPQHVQLLVHLLVFSCIRKRCVSVWPILCNSTLLVVKDIHVSIFLSSIALYLPLSLAALQHDQPNYTHVTTRNSIITTATPAIMYVLFVDCSSANKEYYSIRYSNQSCVLAFSVYLILSWQGLVRWCLLHWLLTLAQCSRSLDPGLQSWLHWHPCLELS